MFGAETPKAYDRFIVEPVIKETFGVGGGTMPSLHIAARIFCHVLCISC